MMARPAEAREAEHLAKLREFLNAWDPYGLLAQGAPEDEWDGERSKIYSALTRGEIGSSEALADRMAAIFDNSLGGGFTAEECSEVARAIWNWWQAR